MALVKFAPFIKRVLGLLTPAQATAQTQEPDPTSLVAPVSQAIEAPPERALERPSPASRRERLVAKSSALGKDLARTTRTLKPDATLLKTTEGHVLTLAIAEAPPPYDPDADLFDQRIKAQLADLDEQLVQGEDQHALAAAERRRRKEEVAKLGELSPRPAATPLLRCSAAIGITLSLAPAIHDLLSGMFPLLKWLIASGFAGAFALFIVTATLPDDQQES